MNITSTQKIIAVIAGSLTICSIAYGANIKLVDLMINNKVGVLAQKLDDISSRLTRIESKIDEQSK